MTAVARAIPDPAGLLAAIDARCTNHGSPVHGSAHWRGVAWAGRRLAAATPGADPAVVLLFAMFHDSMRVDDGTDIAHGPRAAAFAEGLHGVHYHLPPDRLAWLLAAIREHTTGRSAHSPTVGCCWDADRLNLWRIGIRPDPDYLSTPAAADPATIAWARSLEGQRMSWDAIVDAYRDGDG